MENFGMENMWLQKKREQEFWEDCREIEKAKAKTAAVENIRNQSLQVKQMLRERERERKKAMQDVVQIQENGAIQVITQNLSIESTPRYITNMKFPELTVLKRAEDVDEKIYCVACIVNGQEQQVFLDGNMAGNGSYLLRKFASSGICFVCSAAEAKRLAIQILVLLLNAPKAEKLLPDREGWMKKPDGSFKYVEEGELTWEKVKKQCK